MKIGLVIKELMLKQNIEVADLAKRLGKTKQAVYDMLDKEDVNTSLLRELAAIFNVPITIFFDNSVNNNQSNIFLPSTFREPPCSTNNLTQSTFAYINVQTPNKYSFHTLTGDLCYFFFLSQPMICTSTMVMIMVASTPIIMPVKEPGLASLMALTVVNRPGRPA